MAKRLTPLLFAIFWLLPAAAVFAAVPVSPQELRKQAETAAFKNDPKALIGLFYFVEADKELAGMARAAMKEILALGVGEVALMPVPRDVQTEYVMNGFLYRPNLPVQGYIEFRPKNNSGSGTATSIPYGKKGGRYYFVCNIKEKAHSSRRRP